MIATAASTTGQTQFLATLAEPSRLQIIGLLRRGPMTAGSIAEALGVPAVNASHHLRVLTWAGLLADRKVGRFVEYRLHPEIYSPGGAGEPPSLSAAGVRVVLAG
jgi:DNA-binding transcriptional ArsR family regulator